MKLFVPKVFFVASFTTTNTIYLIYIGLLRLSIYFSLSHTHTQTHIHTHLNFFPNYHTWTFLKIFMRYRLFLLPWSVFSFILFIFYCHLSFLMVYKNYLYIFKTYTFIIWPVLFNVFISSWRHFGMVKIFLYYYYFSCMFFKSFPMNCYEDTVLYFSL